MPIANELGMASAGEAPAATAPRTAVYRPFGAFRLALAAMVYISHSWQFTFARPLDHFVSSVNIGPLAVLAFFMLSGFVIAESVDQFYAGRPNQFLLNRLLRIFPPFWWALAVSMSVHVIFFTDVRAALGTEASRPLSDDAFSVENILTNITGIVPLIGFERWLHTADRVYWFVQFTWAVAVELVFYLAMYSLHATLAIADHLRIPVRRQAYWTGAVAVVFVAHLLGDQSGRGFDRYTQFIPYFLFGVLVYYAFRGANRLAGAGAAVSFVLMSMHCVRFVTEGLQVASLVVWADRAALIALTATFLALARARVSSKTKAIDRKLGDLSYPMYLNQWPVILLLSMVVISSGRSIAGLQVVGFVLVAGVALVSKLVVELPIARVRQRIRGREL